MNRTLFFAAAALGAAVIAWMLSTFWGGHALALVVTACIGVAYAIGIAELLRYRRDSAQLREALSVSQQDAGDLQRWLARVPVALRRPVAARIEGLGGGLPVPVFAPYLVGLLVMLGLLGTFFGMVDTLSGAVTALDGNADLAAIRAGLAAPIAGLGVAFGTSVAGVAASGALGLCATLSRRERSLVVRDLDDVTHRDFSHHQISHRQNHAFAAIEAQAGALPELVDRLDVLADRLTGLGSGIGDTLAANQARFQDQASGDFRALADSVAASLQAHVVETGKLTGDTLRPLLEEAMATVASASRETLTTMANTSEQTMAAMARQSEETQQRVVNDTGEKLSELLTRLAAVEASLHAHGRDSLDQQAAANRELLDAFSRAATENAEAFSHAVAQSTEAFGRTAADSTEQFRLSATQNTEAMIEAQRAHSEGLLEQVGSLLASNGELIEARVAGEREWLSGHEDRLQALAGTTATALEQLRQAEEERSRAALERLDALEASVSDHLSRLGSELEGPMTRLIETASETPRAAADVIARLREELSESMARDNALLDERKELLAELQDTMGTLQEAATAQQERVAEGAAKSAEALAKVSQQFAEQVERSLAGMGNLADNVSGSAAEVASLGEAFEASVAAFGASNDVLVGSLERIELALEQAGSRSDEQLAYYVAQAREIIDHSVLSQKEMIDNLRQLGRQKELFETEAG